MAAAASETPVTVTQTETPAPVLGPMGFARSVVERIVQIVIRWSDPSLEPRFKGYGPLPPTPACPAYLLEGKAGVWTAEWKRELRPAEGILLEDAVKRGVPEEEFRAMVHLAWDITCSGVLDRLLGRERKESVDYTLLGVWIGARLGPGLLPETEAIIAPLYNEPVCGWPVSWQKFRASMEKIHENSAAFLSMHGVSRGMSGAEVDAREASYAAWRTRMGYGSPVLVGGGGASG